MSGVSVSLKRVWDAMLGHNQNVTDVKASRAVDTTYTNTTGKPIIVSVDGQVSLAWQAIGITIDGNLFYGSVGGGQTDITSSVMGIVPDGSTYKITISSGGGTINHWVELR